MKKDAEKYARLYESPLYREKLAGKIRKYASEFTDSKKESYELIVDRASHDIPKRDWDTDQEALVLEREKEIEEAELKKEPAPEPYIKKEIPVWIKSRLTKKVVEK